MPEDYHQRAMMLYKQLPHWFEPGLRETPSDRLIRYTHLIDGIVRLLVDMTTPEIKAETLIHQETQP